MTTNETQKSKDLPKDLDELVTLTEPGHVYTYRESQETLTSTTTFLKQFYENFDPDTVLHKNYDRWQARSDPRYVGKTRDQIKDQWKAKGESARNLGVQMHQMIDRKLNEEALDVGDKSILPELIQFDHFMRDEELQPYRSEWTIFDEEARIGGTVDLLVTNEDGTCDLIDWKRTSKDLSPSAQSWRNMKGCMSDYEDNTYNRYRLQLCVYRMILEANYGVSIRAMRLVQLSSELEEYIVHDIKALPREVIKQIREVRLSQVEPLSLSVPTSIQLKSRAEDIPNTDEHAAMNKEWKTSSAADNLDQAMQQLTYCGNRKWLKKNKSSSGLWRVKATTAALHCTPLKPSGKYVCSNRFHGKQVLLVGSYASAIMI
ncbi:hypothetical protein CYMTET_52039 [Cymbomonas tetramitiformis]|uniref:PD-(D/E)XK endonuclease-like domain-containing protein n=1 Tax=Cymbomonas tetramitiformis TaxID=36881 RepID=A0AAE0BKZ7_9CHLO|nr:hypothetical protein CYMTET_52039 [Cymbomonas tetramitiformis]